MNKAFSTGKNRNLIAGEETGTALRSCGIAGRCCRRLLVGAAICVLCGSAGLEIFSPVVSHAATAAEGITARINPGGPENWPPDQALSTQTPGMPQPAPGQAAPGVPMTPAQGAVPQPAVQPAQTMPMGGQTPMPGQAAPGVPMTPAQGTVPQPAVQDPQSVA